MDEKGVVIQGLDVFDVVGFITAKNKKFQAVFLNDLEEVVGKDTDAFNRIRKLYLDSQNNFTRSVLRAIFGNDFETK